MIKRGFSAEGAFAPFERVELPYFHDASDGKCMSVRHASQG